jgi:hypothetical protein
VRKARAGTGNPRSHRCKSSDKGGRSSRKIEGSKREDAQKNSKEEFEHFRNNSPYKPDSDCAPGQRTRKNLPRGGGNPRPITDGLQPRA